VFRKIVAFVKNVANISLIATYSFQYAD